MLSAATQRALLYGSLAASAITIAINVVLGPFDPDPSKAYTRYLAPIAFNLGGSVIAILGWIHAGKMSGPARTAVHLVAIGLGGYMVGQWTWLVYNLQGIDAPYPSLADAGYLLLPLMAIAGALILLRATRRRIQGIDLALAIAIPSTAFLLIYATLIQPRYDAEQDLVRTLVDLAYPTADATYIALALSLIYFSRADPLTPAIRRLSLAMLFMATTDILWIVGLDRGFYFTGSWIDILYILAAITVGWSLLLFPASISSGAQSAPRAPLTSV
jgi:hypothetical protein